MTYDEALMINNNSEHRKSLGKIFKRKQKKLRGKGGRTSGLSSVNLRSSQAGDSIFAESPSQSPLKGVDVSLNFQVFDKKKPNQ